MYSLKSRRFALNLVVSERRPLCSECLSSWTAEMCRTSATTQSLRHQIKHKTKITSKSDHRFNYQIILIVKHLMTNKYNYGFNGLSPSLALNAFASAISNSFGSISLSFFAFFSLFRFFSVGDFDRFRSFRFLSREPDLDLDFRDRSGERLRLLFLLGERLRCRLSGLRLLFLRSLLDLSYDSLNK